MNAEEYLFRIGLERDDVTLDPVGLAKLQRAHLLTVPFENLDIHDRIPIRLDVACFYEKIVGRRRGGFCYELNGLFDWLLTELGFKSEMISARVAVGNGHFGPEFDHLALIVETDSEKFIADVGFGDFSSSPLKLTADIEQKDESGVFLIRQASPSLYEVLVRKRSGWESCYIFGTKSYQLGDFAGMCEFHQTSPKSHFTKGRLCSQLSEEGRKTLTDRNFQVSGSRRRLDVTAKSEFDRILADEFGIRITDG